MSYCPSCLCRLRGLRMLCPECRHSTVGWLHVAVIAALDAALLLRMLKFI